MMTKIGDVNVSLGPTRPRPYLTSGFFFYFTLRLTDFSEFTRLHIPLLSQLIRYKTVFNYKHAFAENTNCTKKFWEHFQVQVTGSVRPGRKTTCIFRCLCIVGQCKDTARV